MLINNIIKKKQQNHRKGISIFCTAFWFLLMLLLILFAKMAIFEFYRVSSASMENTLLVNDFLLIDKLSYGCRTPNKVVFPLINQTMNLPSFKLPSLREIKVGDVVVFREAIGLNPHLLVKRCVAVAGQTVQIKNKTVFVDSVAIDSSIVQSIGQNMIIHRDAQTLPPEFEDPQVKPFGGNNRDNFGPLQIPAGSIFVMGDNRDQSLDSRYFGFVDQENIIGRVILIYFSSETGINSGWQSINWFRLGRFVK